MNPEIYKVTTIGKGTLYVMPRPSSEWLRDDIAYFSKLGVNLVVSHLEKNEEYEVGLQNEEAFLKEAGIGFISFPIKDRNLPQAGNYSNFIEELYPQIINGANIAIHCRAGIGRTGLTSSCLLIRNGVDSDEAMNIVSAARGTQIPDTQEQYDFICDFVPSKT